MLWGKTAHCVKLSEVLSRYANKIELETISIAEPLQNWQHAQNP